VRATPRGQRLHRGQHRAQQAYPRRARPRSAPTSSTAAALGATRPRPVQERLRRQNATSSGPGGLLAYLLNSGNGALQGYIQIPWSSPVPGPQSEGIQGYLTASTAGVTLTCSKTPVPSRNTSPAMSPRSRPTWRQHRRGQRLHRGQHRAQQAYSRRLGRAQRPTSSTARPRSGLPGQRPVQERLRRPRTPTSSRARRACWPTSSTGQRPLQGYIGNNPGARFFPVPGLNPTGSRVPDRQNRRSDGLLAAKAPAPSPSRSGQHRRAAGPTWRATPRRGQYIANNTAAPAGLPRRQYDRGDRVHPSNSGALSAFLSRSSPALQAYVQGGTTALQAYLLTSTAAISNTSRHPDASSIPDQRNGRSCSSTRPTTRRRSAIPRRSTAALSNTCRTIPAPWRSTGSARPCSSSTSRAANLAGAVPHGQPRALSQYLLNNSAALAASSPPTRLCSSVRQREPGPPCSSSYVGERRRPRAVHHEQPPRSCPVPGKRPDRLAQYVSSNPGALPSTDGQSGRPGAVPHGKPGVLQQFLAENPPAFQQYLNQNPGLLQQI